MTIRFRITRISIKVKRFEEQNVRAPLRAQQSVKHIFLDIPQAEENKENKRRALEQLTF